MPAKPEVAVAVEVASAPAKSKKMLLIIVAAVVVLGLAGGAGWFFLGKKTAVPEGEEEVPEPVHEVRHGPPTYLPLDNMVVNLADPGGEKVAQVGVTLELSDAKAPEKVRAYLPAIRSGILMLLSQRTAEELLQREGKEKLASDILAEASRHFSGEVDAASKKNTNADEGESPVRAVLFSSFIIQ